MTNTEASQFDAQWDPTQAPTATMIGHVWKAITVGTMYAFCGLTEEPAPYWERDGEHGSTWIWVPGNGILSHYHPDGSYTEWEIREINR